MSNPYPSIRLGVNIDHVATLRQARLTLYPDPLQAGMIAERAGADTITVHLREDSRHIQRRDVELLKQQLLIPLNLEMAATAEMVEFAIALRPQQCCLVPEKREELTTEGGLDVVQHKQALIPICRRLRDTGIQVSLFIDPQMEQLQAALDCQAAAVEIHTGHYAEHCFSQEGDAELQRIVGIAQQAHKHGLIVNAGHGLHYHNAQQIAAIAEISELHIGHSIIARAVFDGLENAVREMKNILQTARAWIKHEISTKR